VLFREPAGDVAPRGANDEYLGFAAFRRSPVVGSLDGSGIARLPAKPPSDGRTRFRGPLSTYQWIRGQCRVSLHPSVHRLQRAGVATQADRPLGAGADGRQLVRDRSLELLGGRRRDLGGGGWLRVEWRVLGFPPCRGDGAEQPPA